MESDSFRATCVRGDFRDAAVPGEFRDAAVLSEPALDMVERVLKPGGGALIKVFEGSRFQVLVAASRGKFAEVRLSKPLAARPRQPRDVFAS